MRSRRSKRGVGAILAASFMLLILILGFSVFLVIQSEMGGFQESVNAVNTLEFERGREDLVILGHPFSNLTSDRYLNMTVENRGFVEIRMLYVGIFNTTSNDVGTHNYSQIYRLSSPPTEVASILINPGEILGGISHPLQLTTLQKGTVNFTIHIVSDRGSVFTVFLLQGVFVSGGQGEPGPPGAPGSGLEPGPVKLETFGLFRFVVVTPANYPLGLSWMAGQEVGLDGYPANALPDKSDILFVLTVRNIDEDLRDITLNRFSSVQGVATETGAEPKFYLVGFSVSDPNSTSSTPVISPYSPVTLFHDAPTTLYFSADSPGGTTPSGTPTVPTTDQLFWSMVLLGTFSDDTLYGQNIPFQSSLVTKARIDSMTPICGVELDSVTLTGSGFDGPTDVFWINSDGSVTKVDTGAGTATTVTFTVPAAEAGTGFYGIYMTDMVKVAYATFDYACP